MRDVRTDEWGVQLAHSDGLGHDVTVPDETRAMLHGAMGVDPSAPPPDPGVLVLRQGETAPIDGPAEVLLEEGESRVATGTLPADLPLGYHRLRDRIGERRLIVGPHRCYLPEGLRTWGWALQLYAARSRESWGVGDLDDLGRVSRWAAGLGAGVVLVNPLNAVNPLPPVQASPYFPGTRLYRNPLYAAIGSVPGAGAPGLAALFEAGRALNRERLIDRDGAFSLKMRALQRLWSRFPGDARFERYVEAEGRPLADFATHCALSERHRSGWLQWPAEHRRPDSPAVSRFARENRERIRFHQWVQWLLDRQLEEAGSAIRILHDLPVGVDQNGADAWAWQDLFADGVTVGAPPDDFNADGQDWGLPPLIPHRLRQAGYEPFIQTIRAALRHAGGLRIDHVMGLFRLYWVPRGKGPREGAFVRYPARDLLTITALESQRAGAFVVGEDLGTVEDGVREELAGRRILSYKLLWFEDRPPAEYPALSLAAVTTHDLPTIPGLWSGAESHRLRERGLVPNEEGLRQMRARLAERTGLEPGATVEEAVRAAHRVLGSAASAVVTATLEDALGVEERPNMPGTTSEWPNWRAPLPLTVEEIEADPRPRALAREIAAGRAAGDGADAAP